MYKKVNEVVIENGKKVKRKLTKEEKSKDKIRQKKRTAILSKIRNEGMQRHNFELLTKGKKHSDKSKNVLLVKRRDSTPMSESDILCCPKCQMTISRHQLAVHTKKHHRENAGRNAQTKAMAFQPVGKEVSENFKHDILDTLQMGNIRLIIRRDPLIIARGEKLYKKFNTVDQPKQKEHIRYKCREIAKIVERAPKQDPKVRGLEDLMKPNMYDFLVECTKEECKYDEEAKLYGKGSMAKNTGHTINTCIGILRGKYTRAEDEIKLRSLQLFENLMKEWTDDAGRQALQTIFRKRQLT